eukprot:TRINITY_DN4561_c1_g2_i1.p1 TRINITY_DN4561_c1_g2~~TRINITY_DN4561_c1_g2_i1.p1  ORF type:complete len:899 (+),score=153.67 TRINITY_DN4561_c1_g2_i1:64-2760(+)
MNNIKGIFVAFIVVIVLITLSYIKYAPSSLGAHSNQRPYPKEFLVVIQTQSDSIRLLPIISELKNRNFTVTAMVFIQKHKLKEISYINLLDEEMFLYYAEQLGSRFELEEVKKFVNSSNPEYIILGGGKSSHEISLFGMSNSISIISFQGVMDINANPFVSHTFTTSCTHSYSDLTNSPSYALIEPPQVDSVSAIVNSITKESESKLRETIRMEADSNSFVVVVSMKSSSRDTIKSMLLAMLEFHISVIPKFSGKFGLKLIIVTQDVDKVKTVFQENLALLAPLSNVLTLVSNLNYVESVTLLHNFTDVHISDETFFEESLILGIDTFSLSCNRDTQTLYGTVYCINGEEEYLKYLSRVVEGMNHSSSQKELKLESGVSKKVVDFLFGETVKSDKSCISGEKAYHTYIMENRDSIRLDHTTHKSSYLNDLLSRLPTTQVIDPIYKPAFKSGTFPSFTYSDLYSWSIVPQPIETYGYASTHPIHQNIIPTTPDPVNSYDNSITVVVGAWRRPNSIERVIDSILGQKNVNITEVFISSFASPTEPEYDNVMMKYNNHSKVRFVKGKPQLKYWGRFQQIMHLTNARYLAIVDDDCISRLGYYDILIRTMQTKYYGVMGAKAIQSAAVGHGFFDDIGFSFQDVNSYEADLVGGVWFLELDWLRVCFRERLSEWRTGEDFYVSYLLKKYAGVGSVLPPYDPSNHGGTYFSSDDYMNISLSADTTVGEMFDIRKVIYRNIYLRGSDYMRNPRFLPDYLFFVENLEQAKLISTLITSNMKYKVIATNHTYRDDLFNYMKVSKSHVADVFDLKLGWDYNRIMRPVDVYHDVSFSVNQILVHLHPKMIIIPFGLSSTNNTALHACALTAFQIGSQVGVYPINVKEDIKMYNSILSFAKIVKSSSDLP